MTKLKEQFVCTECNYRTSKWAGKCPGCMGWNTFAEDKVSEISHKKVEVGDKAQTIATLAHVLENAKSTKESERIVTGLSELDRVFGGGIYNGSLALLTGEPGIGKSTLTLRICQEVARSGKKVLYVSGEESLGQVANRASRLGMEGNELSLLHHTEVEAILGTVLTEGIEFLVIDSIQVMYAENSAGAPGSMSQVRFTTELIMEFAKARGLTVLIIGHVTKEGTLAGPRALEHLVDTVLYLDGERSQNLRILRTEKNRFGPTDEVGVFAMEESGLVEVTNPSEIFLEGRREGAEGSCITATVEGTRSFLLEVQALTTYTKFGYPKRTAVGFHPNRLQILIAVASKFGGVSLDSHDVYVNIVGGLRVKETALDCAVLMALVSSKLSKPIPSGVIAIGEIGLTGEVRTVSNLEKRVKEAHKLGVQTFVLPNKTKLPKLDGATYIHVSHVSEIIKLVGSPWQ